MGQFGARRIRIGLEVSHSSHNEPGHTKSTLESLLIKDALLHGVQLSVGGLQPFDCHNFGVANCMSERRAGVARHIVDEYSARSALGSIASDLGAGET